MTDVTDEIAGLAPDSAIARLRRERAGILADTQGAYDALFHPADPGRIPASARLGMGLRVAELEQDTPLADHFRAALAKAGGVADDARLAALLHHADLVTRTPDAAGGHLDTLRGLGFDERDIVAATQLVAFVTFQIRVLAGLRLLKDEAA